MQLFGLDNYFYHASIRKYVALFGSIFSDIHIKRKADDSEKEEIIKVPIKYGHGNMYIKVNQDENREIAQHARILPAMAFELGDISKDVARKTNSMNRIQNVATDVYGMKQFQYNRIPYTFNFKLRIRTKNTSDMLQIVEQIIPVFDGNLSIDITDTTGMQVNQDITIVLLNETRMEDNFDDGLSGRLIEWHLQFELKGYLYKKTQSKYVIKEFDLVSTNEFGYEEYDTISYDLAEKQQILTDLREELVEVTTPISKVVRRKRKG